MTTTTIDITSVFSPSLPLPVPHALRRTNLLGTVKRLADEAQLNPAPSPAAEGVFIAMQGHSRMIIYPRISKMLGRSTSGGRGGAGQYTTREKT